MYTNEVCSNTNPSSHAGYWSWNMREITGVLVAPVHLPYKIHYVHRVVKKLRFHCASQALRMAFKII
jgi:hypothetical protein